MKRFAFLLLAALLTACVPAIERADASPLVLVFNGPSEHAQLPAAQAVSGDINVAQTQYTFASDLILRFRETHNAFGDHLVVENVARQGRNLGAPLSVIVGTPVLTRDVSMSEGRGGQNIQIELELVARFIGTDAATEITSISSGIYATSRWEPADASLPELRNDPQVQALLDAASANLAPRVDNEIQYLLSELGY